MAVKQYKPTSPGRRKSSVQAFDELTKFRPEKSLLIPRLRSGGRNNTGKITVRHRGGGTKKYIRLIDFDRHRYDQAASVLAIEYDPNRSANLALLQYIDGKKAYIIAPLGLGVGASVVASQHPIDIKPGNRLPLEFIPTGIAVHNVEYRPGEGGKLVRGAGTSAQLVAIEGDYAHLRLPSGEVRMVAKECAATVGQVGNVDYRNVRWGKAGRMRHRGFRPSVRGKAMNPIDHPHGGGEGLQPIGLKHPKTPWGKPALGVPTRKPKKVSSRLILERRKKKR